MVKKTKVEAASVDELRVEWKELEAKYNELNAKTDELRAERDEVKKQMETIDARISKMEPDSLAAANARYLKRQFENRLARVKQGDPRAEIDKAVQRMGGRPGPNAKKV